MTTGRDFSLLAGYMINTENDATNYKTGNELHVDAMFNQFVSWKLRGQFTHCLMLLKGCCSRFVLLPQRFYSWNFPSKLDLKTRLEETHGIAVEHTAWPIHLEHIDVVSHQPHGAGQVPGQSDSQVGFLSTDDIIIR